ncbi:proline dehydrogenase family protein [Halococcus sp. IIIV-5B]|uniref:proline dehydrogenase family protein n=1 Tax=Halococcus sp. IIIV-5B TaxID=2321230 RepID=UPI000E71BC51|nr:proline dehydrogenase family protein [Halococcus sp. IIIV-5B]RJS97144.1 proline dehydrogenase [Halococcus sp. IIIV-5B]
MIPPIANRFVAGETHEAVVDHARELETHGVRSICNLLGEHYTAPEPAAADRDAYRSLLDAIAAADVGACISVKPSQIGLDVSEDCFRDNFEQIVDHAEESGTFVWLDMEDHSTTDPTLDAYTHHADEYKQVGVCVQANLKRTPEDLRRLADSPGKVRLVKGAYDEPGHLAHRGRAQVNDAYRECLDVMFERFDDGIAVASHDAAMVKHAVDRHEEYGTDFEIQMLMGVRNEVQYDLADRYDVWQYVPYGGKWFSYFSRRVMERRENLTFALRALVGR